MSKVTLIPDLRFPEFKNEGDWEECSIESVGDVVTGGTPSKEDVDYWGGDFVWATAQDFKNKYIFNSIQKLTQKGKDKSRVIPKDSVLVTCIASIGLNAINKVDCATNQQINAIICNSKNHFEFVYYSISHNGNRLKNLAGRTAVPIISKSVFEKFIIHKPESPKEQQKIASCLSSLDEVIAAHSHKLELLKDHKKGLMQNLFPQEGEKVPKYRFKEFEKNGVWVEEPLSSKVSVIDGDRGLNYPKAEEYSSDGYCLFLSAKNVTKSGFVFNEFQFITKEKDELLRKGKLSRFDIVLTTRGSLGQFAFFDESIQFENIRINSGMVILRAKDNRINPNYLYSYFNSNSIQSAIKSQGFGNAVQQLTVAVINNFTLRYPYDPKEQQKIAECLSSLDSLITAQEKKIGQLKLHKKGLMQGLFPKINN
jgi:type I restriction enzyme S subunit